MKVLNIVNYKLIKRSYKSNLSIINNNINKDCSVNHVFFCVWYNLPSEAGIDNDHRFVLHDIINFHSIIAG